MITIQKTSNKKPISRYEEYSIISAIENLSRQDKKNRLLFTLLDKPLTVSLDTIKNHLTSVLGFTIRKKHHETIRQGFGKYNIKITFSNQQKKQNINTRVINSDHNHFTGRGR